MFEKHAKQISSEYSIVEAPDHPNLISAPDAIVAKKGEIVAYYRLHSDEKSRIKNFLSRLAISRLALPTHTKHVFLAAADTEQDNCVCYKNFDRVVENIDLVESLKLLNEKTNTEIVERNSFLRDYHYVKFNVIYNLSLKQESVQDHREREIYLNENLFENVYYSDWLKNTRSRSVRQEFFKSRLFFKTDAGVVAMPEFNTSNNKIDLLRNLCLSALQIESNFDNGVLESNYLLSKFMLSNKVPSYKHDVLKGLRSSAFCGLSLSSARSIDSIKNYSEFLAHKIEGGIREFNKKKNRHIKRNHNW